MARGSEHPHWYAEDEVLLQVVATLRPPNESNRHREVAQTAVSLATLETDLAELDRRQVVDPAHQPEEVPSLLRERIAAALPCAARRPDRGSGHDRQ
jgi:hypothetical protein